LGRDRAYWPQALRGWAGRTFGHLKFVIFPSGAPDSTLL
jgi:hypothetical protein